MTVEQAALGARLTAETDRDGVRTHGIARLPRFAEMVQRGAINVAAAPECVASFGAMERWRGHRGPGNVAAYRAMARAIELAKQNGIGAVALADTSHWMRGGTYGWQAADAGCAAICWTNTLPNLPPWGATVAALGNNPLVMAAPKSTGEHVVLDMAMSQFSYGTLAAYSARGEQLPVVGGWDEHGELTRDAAAIERTQRALPVGFWKGSGLAFVLDVLAAMLAGGKATHEFSTDPLEEVGQSQVFLAMAPGAMAERSELDRLIDQAATALHAAGPDARYPGEGTLRARAASIENGVALDDAVWAAFTALEH